MLDILKILNWLLPVLYLAMLASYAAAFFLRTPRRGRSAALAAVLGVHAGFLLLLSAYLGGRMVPATGYEVLSVMAAGLAAVYLVVEYSTRERRTGVFVLLAVLLLQYTSSVFLPGSEFGAQPPEAPSAGGYWAKLHMIPAMMAYIAFTISAIYGVLHLLAMRDLRRHRFGVLFDRLPPLETIAKMNWHSLLTGFVFMTLAIASGPMLAAGRTDMTSIDARTFIKILAAPAAWLIYGGAIVGKYAAKWDSAKVSRLSAAGFVIVLAMLVLSILLS